MLKYTNMSIIFMGFKEQLKEQTTIGMKKSIYGLDTSQIANRPCSDGEYSLFCVCA